MSSSTPPHYVRLKRYNLTVFIHCDVNHDTVQMIKERYEKLVGRTFYTVSLYLGRQNLDDSSTLYNCGIESEGAELVVVHSKGTKLDGSGEYIWEEIEEAMSPPPKEEQKALDAGSAFAMEGQENGEGTGDIAATPSGEKNLVFIESNVESVGS